MQWLFRKSKWIHKYIGLILVLFLIWMSVSGILMNHPNLISGLSVPKWLVPSPYHIENWSRSALIKLVYSSQNPQTAYGCGKQGIWKSEDGGRSFAPMMAGLPESRFYRKTYDLLLLESSHNQLIAATHNGLFSCDLATEQWRPLIIADEKFVKLQQVKNSVLAFSQSNIYQASLENSSLDFKRIEARRDEPESRVSLVKLFFDVHYGKAWGLPGLLFFDFLGLVIFFLSISAFYAWFFPWKRKRETRKIKKASSRKTRLLFKYMLKYHLKIGIWVAVFMLIIGGTGLFMRPPLLAVLAGSSIPKSYYPGFLPDNPWDHKIHNAVYDEKSGSIIIDAEDGLWQAPDDFSQPFQKLELEVPIFVMGSTVLAPYKKEDLLIGSFSGLFHWQRQSEKAFSLRNGKAVNDVSRVRPSKFMVTGYIRTPDGREFMNTHEQGIIPINGADRGELFQQPAEITSGFRMPLWNYLFEIHNARFFKSWIGALNILVVPLGSVLFILIIFSGIYDWFYLKIVRRKKPVFEPEEQKMGELELGVESA
ncbi:MAG: PepSY domain-containing protein [Calditrichaeota bacterium]|nr:MAG: PepSY domain-containing protein [Calditrichota bacterium]